MLADCLTEERRCLGGQRHALDLVDHGGREGVGRDEGEQEDRGREEAGGRLVRRARVEEDNT